MPRLYLHCTLGVSSARQTESSIMLALYEGVHAHFRSFVVRVPPTNLRKTRVGCCAEAVCAEWGMRRCASRGARHCPPLISLWGFYLLISPPVLSPCSLPPRTCPFPSEELPPCPAPHSLSRSLSSISLFLFCFLARSRAPLSCARTYLRTLFFSLTLLISLGRAVHS